MAEHLERNGEKIKTANEDLLKCSQEQDQVIGKLRRELDYFKDKCRALE